ncbi:MAG: capsule assembly Wzi family protein, partial [Gammaproteobacteria bacterium]|nr:capsule assembly Wzi family protein [Gammaproteobacteria bacterium]
MRILAILVCLWLPPQIAAQQLLSPGDAWLRADLQLLAAAGLIDLSLTTWPVSGEALAIQIESISTQDLDHGNAAALLRVRRGLSGTAVRTVIAVGEQPGQPGRFSDLGRDRGVGVGYRWSGERWQGRLRARFGDADGHHELDDSYLGMRLGNWLLSAGAVPRWWGPGHDGSLILSHQARPVPALALDTVTPINVSQPWLRWLVPTQWHFFAGQLEQRRVISDARLLGARVVLQPVDGLEIGLSRTAQWGGAGRPQDFESLANLILGRDNRGDSGITLDDEPGNQLGGIDLHYRLGRSAIYTQWIGEDEAGGLPSRFIALAGFERWRRHGNGVLNWYVELADTTVEFYKSQSRRDLAYEHFIYRSGYRFRGTALGHPMDNDGLMIAFGVTRSGDRAQWQLGVRRTELNRDGGGDSRHTLAP